MRKTRFSLAIMTGIAAATLLGAVAARATSDAFVWKDSKYGYTFSFPDSWGIQTKDTPYTRIRIAGPVNSDWATCSIQVHKDGRLQIYPKRLMTQAVDDTLNRSFWERQVAQHDDAVIRDFIAPASLGGRGDATAIRETFVLNIGHGKRINMYGEQIASIYGKMRYVFACSSKLDQFDKYAPLFGSIMESIQLSPRYAPFATGYYRDFLSDPQLALPRTKPGTIHIKNSYQVEQQ